MLMCKLAAIIKARNGNTEILSDLGEELEKK